MELEELFVAVVISGISCINAALPAAAWARARDGRFLLLAAAHSLIAGLAAIWAASELFGGVLSGWSVPLPVLLVVLVVSVLLLATTLWPRRS